MTSRRPERSCRFPAVPLHQVDGGDHYCWCEICLSWVDEEDLEEVMQHIDPDHKAPAKN